MNSFQSRACTHGCLIKKLNENITLVSYTPVSTE
jgi:hypothetical protein